MERRDFLKNISAGGALLAFNPLMGAISESPDSYIDPNHSLFSFILFEDCVQLIQNDNKVDPLYKEMLKGCIRNPLLSNLSRLTSLNSNANNVFGLINSLKTVNAQSEIKWREEKTSFVLGWLMHNACIKNIRSFNDMLLKKGHDHYEICAYQDVEVIKARFLKPVSKFSGKDFTSLMLDMATRTITRIHTFTPDRNDGGSWIERITEWRSSYYNKMHLYGIIAENPQASKYKLFCNNGNFIRTDDPVITGNFSPESISGNKSLYSLAVLNGWNAVLAYQSVMIGEISPETLKTFI